MMNIGSATYKKGKPEHVNKKPGCLRKAGRAFISAV
jgi:hypothetical protein